MRRVFGAAMLAVFLVAAACGSSSKPSSSTNTSAPAAKTKINVGQKDFAGAVLLSQLYGQALAAKNFDVKYTNLGPTEVTYKALKDGSITGGRRGGASVAATRAKSGGPKLSQGLRS